MNIATENAKYQKEKRSMVKRAKRSCPNCGTVQSEQWEDNGKGYYTENGQTYCCQGCAENTGCTCIKAGGGG